MFYFGYFNCWVTKILIYSRRASEFSPSRFEESDAGKLYIYHSSAKQHAYWSHIGWRYLCGEDWILSQSFVIVFWFLVYEDKKLWLCVGRLFVIVSNAISMISHRNSDFGYNRECYHARGCWNFRAKENDKTSEHLFLSKKMSKFVADKTSLKRSNGKNDRKALLGWMTLKHIRCWWPFFSYTCEFRWYFVCGCCQISCNPDHACHQLEKFEITCGNDRPI